MATASNSPPNAGQSFDWFPDVIYAFEDAAGQAFELASAVGADFVGIDVHTFPDGESRVRVDAGRPRAQASLYRSLHQPNAKLIEVLLAASAIRDAGVRELSLIAPYLPYMRQDRAFHPGEAVSQKVIGDVLGGAFDAVVTVEPHLHRTHSLSAVFRNKPAFALSAAAAMAAHIRRRMPDAAVIVGPDEESASLAAAVAAALKLTWFVGAKRRSGDYEVSVALPGGEIAGKPVVIVDDIISSGRTISTLARKLKSAGAGPIAAYAAHALFNETAARDMENAGVASVVSLGSVPHPSNDISIVDCLVKGLRNIQ